MKHVMIQTDSGLISVNTNQINYIAVEPCLIYEVRHTTGNMRIEGPNYKEGFQLVINFTNGTQLLIAKRVSEKEINQMILLLDMEIRGYVQRKDS